MFGRLLRDESGMTMALAMMMILLISVMGAGLLAFATRDFDTVLEVNQGQRAFEVADAGVQAAKRQLSSDCIGNTTCLDHYDDDDIDDDGDFDVIGTEDIQWSVAKGGVTLNDLDGDGNATTTDNVEVTIDYRYVQGDFKIVSESTYDGEAKRKLEAIFEGVSGGAGGDGVGHPLYYTPSSIKIEGELPSSTTNRVTLSGMSLFSEKDILIQGLNDPTAFKNEWETNGGIFHIPSPNDAMNDWDSTKFPAGTSGTWNTVGRRGHTGYANPNNSNTKAFNKPGFAAEGKICGYVKSTPATEPGTCNPTSTSIADGVYGYDSTTGTKGNNLTFVDKDPPDKNPNDTGTITYPFPRPVPKEERLKGIALETGRFYEGSSPPWDTLFNDGNQDKVIFIDAQNNEINFDTTGSANNKGLLVVWCGQLNLNEKFQGIILNLYGDGDTPPGEPGLKGSSSCEEPDDEMGIFRNNGQDFSGWLYAEGGTDEKAGIELAKGSSINFLPGGDWSFFNDAFTNSPPVAFAVQSWRECYNETCDDAGL